MSVTLERCPGCGAWLPQSDGPTHRYIGASAACWAIYSTLHSAGEPPLAPDAWNTLLVDAYAVQHPGTPSDQSIQSVGVHLLALYGVFEQRIAPQKALWIRQRALREGRQPKHNRFVWLEPPSFDGCLTVAEIVQAPAAAGRAEAVKRYVQQVWSAWSQVHAQQVAGWYEWFILPDRI